MKLPSLIRTSKFSRFHYEPRYYDPIKEEIEGKLRAARANQGSDNQNSYDTSSISAAFSKRQRKSSHASVVQLLFAAAMIGTAIGWYFYGNDIFYVYLALSPIYFYFRIKGRNKPRD
ncbi:MAG: hypothetical protein ABJF11_12840 [Reichenbachiella sp.]|uniref:hypothetical protein n=1 Tax=Reichenbachiella sp. TaxID=2184521 RepID=UPI003267341A